jgi:hypothetical protein
MGRRRHAYTYDPVREALTFPPPIAEVADRNERVRAHFRSVLALAPHVGPAPTASPSDVAHVVDALVQAVASGSVTRDRACTQKKAYRTPDYAERLAVRMSRVFGVRQVAYPCPFCHQYHLTRRPETR